MDAASGSRKKNLRIILFLFVGFISLLSQVILITVFVGIFIVINDAITDSYYRYYYYYYDH